MLSYWRKHVWFQIKETECFALWLVGGEGYILKINTQFWWWFSSFFKLPVIRPMFSLLKNIFNNFMCNRQLFLALEARRNSNLEDVPLHNHSNSVRLFKKSMEKEDDFYNLIRILNMNHTSIVHCIADRSLLNLLIFKLLVLFDL